MVDWYCMRVKYWLSDLRLVSNYKGRDNRYSLLILELVAGMRCGVYDPSFC